ncbi:hypothetical protein HDU88_007951 [Geranomyces variabilis]|nr:hypothetical protein HDU88_007951 [Geranomyces variabilis]
MVHTAPINASETRVEDEREDDDIDTREQDGSGRTTIRTAVRWVLSTGKDVAQVVAAARLNVPQKSKATRLLCLGIIDITRQDPLLEKLFTIAEWKEIGDDFRSAAQLTRVDDSLIDSLKQIMDSMEEVILRADESEIIGELEKLIFEPPRLNALRRAVQQDAANIIRLKPIASEAVMDNATTAHLKRWLVEKGEVQSIGSKVARDHDISSTERAASGQKLDLRVTLANTNEQLEALACLRSDGLPIPRKKKIKGDRLDLLNCLMEILLSYMRQVDVVPAEKLADLFVLSLQSFDWTSCVPGDLTPEGAIVLSTASDTLDLKSLYAAAPPAKCESARNRKNNKAKAASRRRSMAK